MSDLTFLGLLPPPTSALQACPPLVGQPARFTPNPFRGCRRAVATALCRRALGRLEGKSPGKPRPQLLPISHFPLIIFTSSPFQSRAAGGRGAESGTSRWSRVRRGASMSCPARKREHVASRSQCKTLPNPPSLSAHRYNSQARNDDRSRVAQHEQVAGRDAPYWRAGCLLCRYPAVFCAESSPLRGEPSPRDATSPCPGRKGSR